MCDKLHNPAALPVGREDLLLCLWEERTCYFACGKRGPATLPVGREDLLLCLWEERTCYLCDGKLGGLSRSGRGDEEINVCLCQEWNRDGGFSDLLRDRHTDRSVPAVHR